MDHMYPFLNILPGESFVSWINRFARFQCNLQMHDFFRLVGLGQQDLMQGKDYVFQRMAALSGVPYESLMAGATVQVASRLYQHRAESFFPEFRASRHLTFCPACLMADLSSGGRGKGSKIGQTNWVFSPVRTCATHGVALDRSIKVARGQIFNDVGNLAPDLTTLETLTGSSTSRRRSSLQRYVENRFQKLSGPKWLDDQPIDLGCRATEMLGACVEFGAHVKLSRLNEDDWDTAGHVGFEFTSRGDEGIREGLDEILSRPQKLVRKSGAQGAFGALYKWVQFRKVSKPVGPILDVLREHILDTLPVRPGTELFGKRIERTRRHTIATLATKYKIQGSTIELAFQKAGLMTSGQETADTRCSFDAVVAEALVEKLGRAIPIAKVPEHIGCTRTQAERLVKGGILQSVASSNGNASGRFKGVDKLELEGFLGLVRQHGEPVNSPGQGMVDVFEVSNLLNVSVVAVIRLLLDRKLETVELLPEQMKLKSVLVSHREVAFALGSVTGNGGMTVSKVGKKLRLPSRAVYFLIGEKDGAGEPFLRSCGQVRHMGVMRPLVDPDEVENFSSKYRKLIEIVDYKSRNLPRVREELRSKGIFPVWDSGDVGAEIYRISDL